jgi:hypothetical protein
MIFDDGALGMGSTVPISPVDDQSEGGANAACRIYFMLMKRGDGAGGE